MFLLVSVAAMMAAQSSAPATSPEPTAAEARAEEKVVCKREVVTGSRSQRKRICMTQQQWDRLSNNSRDDTAALIDKALTYGTRSD
jgi:hypothetical protein